MSSLDLTRFLPPRYRDKTIDTLLKSAFNRHLSKESSVPLYGYVGNPNSLTANDIKLKERDLERQLHQLTQLISVKHGAEKKLFSWPDLIQKLMLLGVDYKSIGDWFRSQSYNFVPPIDLDKFCNYNQYFWIGPWVSTFTALSYEQLGIPNVVEFVAPEFTNINPEYLPEYYVIKRGTLSEDRPISMWLDLPSAWSQWSYINLWVHRDDALEFTKNHPGTVDFSKLTPAIRPIIEYSNKIKLNTYISEDGAPADSGTYNPPVKYRANQPPMFDLYVNDGTSTGKHAGVTSSIFFYSESPDAEIDAELQRRIVSTDGDFIFGNALVREDGSLYFYKTLSEPEIVYEVAHATDAPGRTVVTSSQNDESATPTELIASDLASRETEIVTANDSTSSTVTYFDRTILETANATDSSNTETILPESSPYGSGPYGTLPYAAN